jgi:hypothetical protein
LTEHCDVRYIFVTVSLTKERRSWCTSLLSRRPLIAAIGVCLGLGLSGAQPHASATDVRGQVVLGTLRAQPPIKPARAAFNWELENGVKEVLPSRVSAPRELAVVLIGAGGPKIEQVEVAFSGGALLPATLVLSTGTTLRIRNDDEIGHELYAQGLDGFSAEATSPGATRAVHLTRTGSWPLRDRLAAHASAHLHVVVDLAAVAKLEANGAFAFSDVPPGKYTLKVFRGSSELASKPVEVADKSVTLDPLMLGDAKPSP